ncbi:DUF58 domain-containing protein [Peijinzhouia sedimentorum]
MGNKITIQDIKEVGNLEMLARQMVEGFITGLHKSPYHGFSVEFLEHRLYNPGESTRNIDWKVYAKNDRLFVKRFEEETNLRCVILLDNSTSMYYPKGENQKIHFSILASAALAFLLQRQRDALGVKIFSDKIDWQSPIKSTKVHLNKIFIQLDHLLKESVEEKAPRHTRTSEVLHMMAESIHKRSLVIVFSDMLLSEEDPNEFFSALQHLKHAKHEVILFHTLHYPTEKEFEFDERPHVFVDSETGEEVKIKPETIKAEYKAGMQQYMEEIKLWCHKAKIDLVEVDVTQSVDSVLLAYLIKRSKMK